MKTIIFTLIFILTSIVSFGVERDTVLVAKNKKNNKVLEFKSGRNVNIYLTDGRKLEGKIIFTSDTTFEIGENSYQYKLSDIKKTGLPSLISKFVDAIVVLVGIIAMIYTICFTAFFFFIITYSSHGIVIESLMPLIPGILVIGIEVALIDGLLWLNNNLKISFSNEKYDFSIKVK